MSQTLVGFVGQLKLGRSFGPWCAGLKPVGWSVGAERLYPYGRTHLWRKPSRSCTLLERMNEAHKPSEAEPRAKTETQLVSRIGLPVRSFYLSWKELRPGSGLPAPLTTMCSDLPHFNYKIGDFGWRGVKSTILHGAMSATRAVNRAFTIVQGGQLDFMKKI